MTYREYEIKNPHPARLYRSLTGAMLRSDENVIVTLLCDICLPDRVREIITRDYKDGRYMIKCRLYGINAYALALESVTDAERIIQINLKHVLWAKVEFLEKKRGCPVAAPHS